MCKSVPQMPVALTLTSTSPASTAGTGTSISSSPGPGRVFTRAFTSRLPHPHIATMRERGRGALGAGLMSQTAGSEERPEGYGNHDFGWRPARCGPSTRKRGEVMTRQAATSDQAPAALGPYRQAIVAGGFVFCSGTAGIDPTTGEAPDGIEAQTQQALINLSAVLEAAGASMADLVKTTIFYSNVEDFSLLNAVYARHMPNPPPARSAPANVK